MSLFKRKGEPELSPPDTPSHSIKLTKVYKVYGGSVDFDVENGRLAWVWIRRERRFRSPESFIVPPDEIESTKRWLRDVLGILDSVHPAE